MKKLIHGIFITAIIFIILPDDASATNHLQEMNQNVNRYLAEHEESLAGFTAVILSGGEFFYTHAGYADMEEKLLVNEKTVFEWGSVSKILIWISVMQLVENGLIDLQANIDSYLPLDLSYPKTYSESITMLDLMNHSAGFDDSYTDLMVTSKKDFLEFEQALRAVDVKQVFPPGEIVAYSNYGSALAAYIVEQVSGMDYRDYVAQHIFEALNMGNTAIDPRLVDNEWVKKQRSIVQGYTAERKRIEPNQFVIPLYPVGSVTGTAGDLTKLVNALLSEDGKPLFTRAETMEKLFTPSLYYPGTTIPRIAHGFFAYPTLDGVYGHGGNTLAFSTSIYVSRKDNLGLVVMTNQRDELLVNAGLPELIFAQETAFQMEVEKKLEDSIVWEGVYQPARSPFHGFSKIYGLFQRFTMQKKDDVQLKVGAVSYIQQSPGVYLAEDEYRIYSLDVYEEHASYGKILASIYTDSIQVPIIKHYGEWMLVLLGLSAFLFSPITFLVCAMKRIRCNRWLVLQHLLNVFLLGNIIWMIIQTATMTTYENVRFSFVFNALYVGITIIFSVLLLKRIAISPTWRRTFIVITVMFSLILCANLIYWEFYR